MATARNACAGRCRAWAGVACLALAWLGAPDAGADTLADIRLLSSRGEFQSALDKTDQALMARPQDATLQFQRAVLLMDLQRDAEALALLNSLHQTYPELPDPLNNLALLQARSGGLDEALRSLQAALRNDPGHRLARINLGQVHLMLAARAWETAAAAGPVDPDLAHRLQAVRSLLAGPGR